MPFVSQEQRNFFRMAKTAEGRRKLKRKGRRVPLMKDVEKMLRHDK